MVGILDRLTGNIVPNTPIQLDGTGASFNINLTNDVSVTIENATTVPALMYGVNLICDTIASMPVYLYKRNADGSRDKLQTDIRNKLLNMQPNDYSSGYNLKYSLIYDFLMSGNGYIHIDKPFGSTEIKALYHVPYNEMSLISTNDIDRLKERYYYNYWNRLNVPTFKVMNMVRNPKTNPLDGTGIVEQGSDVIKLLLDLEAYQTESVTNRFTPKVVIEKETIMSKASKDSFREAIKNFFSGAKGGKVLLLDDGMKAKSINTFAENDIVNQKNDAIKSLAMLLKLPMQLYGISGGNLSYSNESYNTIMLLKQTIQPILKLLEDTCNMYLLTESEKNQGYFFEFNTQNLLKTDPKTEYEMYGKAVSDGILTRNEARQRMNWKPLSDEEINKPSINQDEQQVNLTEQPNINEQTDI